MKEAVFKNRPELTPTAEITMEFLRRVVNELNGRRFEFIETALCVQPEGYAEMLSASGNVEDILHYLPELTREFAGKIKPAFTRCYGLDAPACSEGRYYTARDPIGGVSIRGFKHFDPIHGKLMYRFDAAFS